MTKKEVFKNYEESIFPSYARIPIILVKGKGCVVTDIDGKQYLDFFPGWGVSNVGHCHPKVMAAVRDQIGRLIHVPNNFFHPNQAKLAKEIVRNSFPGLVFFCNSGAEANEAAIKFSRIYGGGKRFEIITTERSFHGRTSGAMAATGQSRIQQGFEPLLPGFKIVSFNDIEAIKAAITDKTVAVMVELVQGEGGVNIATPEYVRALRDLCTEKDLLLIVDEVQTGMGRTGEMFAFQHYGITPDVMTLAKGLGGGVPIGAMIARKSIAHIIKPGMHGSTFGGSPLVTKAGLGVFKAIQSEKMLKNARARGLYLMGRLVEMMGKYDFVKEVRGLGLMVGVELTIEGKGIFEDCLANGLIINCTQGNILRIMPVLNVTKKQVDKALFILDKALQKAVAK
jgi:acetylornithine/N-succinyldiaminopimelate aminotransferase